MIKQILKDASLAVLIIAFVFSLATNGFFYWTVIPETRLVQKSLTEERQKSREFIIKNERVRCMTTALGIAYGISKWEGHYYSVIFDDFSTRYGIPWEIYAAVVRIESNYNPTLVSPKGAKGMMQILEPTAESVASQLKINYIKTQTLWNDVINMILGCTYLSDNIKSSGLEDGVKCYLGGPSCLVPIKNPDPEKHQYISEYKSSVWKEYKELVYIFRGVVNESSKIPYAEIHSSVFPDSVVPTIMFYKDTVQTKFKGAKNVRKKRIRLRPTEVIGAPDTSNAQ